MMYGEPNMSEQQKLFETHDEYGNDIIQDKKPKKKLTRTEKMIDPKNPYTVGSSAWNLGNHTLAICFIACILFVIYASYK